MRLYAWFFLPWRWLSITSARHAAWQRWQTAATLLSSNFQPPGRPNTWTDPFNIVGNLQQHPLQRSLTVWWLIPRPPPSSEPSLHTRALKHQICISRTNPTSTCPPARHPWRIDSTPRGIFNTIPINVLRPCGSSLFIGGCRRREFSPSEHPSVRAFSDRGVKITHSTELFFVSGRSWTCRISHITSLDNIAAWETIK